MTDTSGVDVRVRPYGQPDQYQGLQEWSPPGKSEDRAPGVSAADPYADLKEWQPPATQELPRDRPSTTNSMERATIEFQNTMRAAAQGTTPNIKAHEPRLLSDQVEFDEADNPVLKDGRGNLIPFDSHKHVILQDPEDRKLKAFERSDQTDEGRAAGLGRFFMAGQGPGTAQVTRAVPAAIAAAERIGITAPKAVMSENPLVRLGARIVSKLPGGGSLKTSVERGVEQLTGSVDRAIRKSGGNAKPDVAGESFRQGIEQGFKPGIKESISRMYDAVDKGVDHAVQTPLYNTRKAVEPIVAKRASYNDPNAEKGLSVVLSALKDTKGLTYDAIKALRTRIGDMISERVFPDGVAEHEWRSIYGGLSEDLKASVKAAGNEQAVSDFARANAANEYAERWKDKIEKVLGNARRSDESVASTLFRMAGKGAGADLKSLSAARKSVPVQAWNDITANAISRLGKAADGKFDPLKFVKDYGELSDGGKAALFGGAENSNLVPFLNDIAQVSEKFVAAGKFGSAGGAAGHAASGGIGAAMVLAGEQAMHGEWKVPVAIVGSAVGASLMGRLLGMPATAASIARWSRAYDALVNKPGPAALASFNIATRNLANTATEHVGIPAADIEQKIKQNMQVGQEGQPQQ